MKNKKIAEVLADFVEFCQDRDCNTCDYHSDGGGCLEKYCKDVDKNIEEMQKKDFTRKLIYTATLLMVIVFAMMMPSSIPVHKQAICYIIIGIAGAIVDYMVTYKM